MSKYFWNSSSIYRAFVILLAKAVIFMVQAIVFHGIIVASHFVHR